MKHTFLHTGILFIFGFIIFGFAQTADAAVTVETDLVSNVASTTVTFDATLTVTGGDEVLTRGFQFATDQFYSDARTVFQSTSTPGFATGSYTLNATGLTCGTLYYVKAYASTNSDTYHGSELSFTTSACPPQPAAGCSTVTREVGNTRYVTRCNITRTEVIRAEVAPNVIVASSTAQSFVLGIPNAMGTVLSVPVQASSTPVIAASQISVSAMIFVKDLKFGMVDTDVRLLQQYLNTRGFVIAATGPGSAGNETNRFGAMTRIALSKFQKANGITPATGYFGPITRAFISSR